MVRFGEDGGILGGRREHGGGGRRWFAAAAVAAMAMGTMAGCSEDRAADSATSTTTTVPASTAACAEDLLACLGRSSLGDIAPTEPSEATGEPIVLGMINQENTPLGSYPELSSATRAAIEFVNAELGGVNGRPIQLEVCNTEFSPEGSTACAQGFVQDGVPAVLGGIDVFGNGIDTLEENAIPFVGGIPVSTQSVTNDNSYQWSGGTWGATIAFANHAATEVEAEKVAIVYPEFGPITSSAEYGRTTLANLGVTDVAMVPYPITATDLSSPIQAAASNDPDAIVMLAADMGCKGAFDGFATVGVTAKVYLVGACASPAIIEEAGPEKTDGTVFNVEGPIDRSEANVDFALYQAVAEKYGDGFDPIGAGTVTFRSFMNLYRIMVGLDEADLTPAGISEALGAQVDAPSFMGHPSTCDREQLDGLPALCSPQQILAEMTGGELIQIGDWVDVGAIYGAG
ncbi:MAG: ABC transporter substrate-binding protein [Acidimicrobiales bacterium]|nr:ABC transporter substrate-binding protein [Acidimicrobiales bacterium]